MRPSWNDYFMKFAVLAAARSTCPRRAVGAVFVKDRRVLATGYNGSPPGQDHCEDIGCLLEDGRCIRTIHAEQNAIIQAARSGVSIVGTDVYTTSRPCTICARMLAGSGINRIFYLGESPKGWGEEVLVGAGVELVQMTLKDDNGNYLES